MLSSYDMDVQILTISLVVVVLISVVEAFFIYKLYRHYNHFLKGSSSGLMSVLEGIQKTLSSHEQKSIDTVARIKKLEEQGKFHLQNLVVHRFNPFSNTGGDQSFILGLLDAHQTGVVITSLHSRENTRFYVKSVINGEGDPYPLSDEERKILKNLRKDK